MAEGFWDFFSKEAGQARTKARDEFIDGILGAARRAADYYLGPTGIPDRASSAGRVAAEMNPVVGIMDAMQASGEGRYGDAALETAMALAPAYAATKAARPVAEAVQEVLLGGSAAAGDAGRKVIERMNQRGPMPTVYSNPLMRADDTISISDAIEAKYPDVSVDLYGNPEKGYELSRIVVPEGKRGSGVGSKVMDDMINMADSQGAKISLTPDTSFGGTSVARLKDFYKRFGFVENKGKNKDFSTRNTMYREPQKPSLPPARNEAEAMAKRILDMRASGNAADVTDEMMAQADPQYMFNNTPLPMDEASRMERAREMGLLDNTYHATGAEFQHFIPSQVGRHGAGVYTGKNASDVQTFLPKDEVTRRYAEGSMVLPLRIPDDAKMASEMKWQDALPERWNYGDPKDVNDAISGYAEAADTLSQMGFRGVVQPATDWDGRVIFDPRNIRSRFARFDPAFANLKNLSAATGIPVTGLLGYSMLQDEQQ